jgi:hypothetical protein
VITFTDWMIWLGVVLGSFGVMEGLSLAHRRGWLTLSESLRKMLGIKPHRPWQVPACMVFLGFLLWLAIHITTSLV